VDLLSDNAENNNRIKFTAGVRNPRGGDLNECLDGNANFEGSYNNT